MNTGGKVDDGKLEGVVVSSAEELIRDGRKKEWKVGEEESRMVEKG